MMTNPAPTQNLRPVLALGILAALTLAVAGCRGDRSGKPPRQFFPDLDDQPKYKAQSESRFYEDYEGHHGDPDWGRSQRLPVPGTIAFGKQPHITTVGGVNFAKRNDFQREDIPFYLGRRYVIDSGTGDYVFDDNGQPVTRIINYIPATVTVDEELIALGKEKYDIFCITCHGGSGKGDGMVGLRWSIPLPNFHDDAFQIPLPGDPEPEGERWTDGHLFDVIRNGLPSAPGSPLPYRMPAYGHKVSEHEAWAIVAYIRSLQMTQRGDTSMLGSEQRLELNRNRPAANPAANTPASQGEETP